MPRKQKQYTIPVPPGMSKKQIKRRRPINSGYLLDISPLTDNQEQMFNEWEDDKNLFVYGCAGTGKTCLLYTSPSPRD